MINTEASEKKEEKPGETPVKDDKKPENDKENDWDALYDDSGLLTKLENVGFKDQFD
jgi:hypothetical protein